MINMKNYKICFVGVGSIAKRHIKNIKNHLENDDVTFTIDALRSSKRVLKDVKEYINNEYYSYDELPLGYDAIFITNPTKLHYESLEKLNNNSDNFFIEKPLVDVSDINNKFKLDLNKNYYVAGPIRHGSVIKYLKENLNLDSVNSIRCICSTYLPLWHPDEDYTTSYSAKKELGGGVSIDLIHEWDYLTHLFGIPNEVFSILDKVSNLDIETEDISIYIAKYDNMLLELHLDYFGRFPIREIMIFTDDDTIIGDIQNNVVKYLNQDKIIDFSEKRNDYQIEELKYFFKLINNEVDNINSIPNALKILKLTQGEL